MWDKVERIMDMANIIAEQLNVTEKQSSKARVLADFGAIVTSK